jgi:hypothetical protein
MDLFKLNKLEIILADSYSDAEWGGAPIQGTYEAIAYKSSSVSNDEAMETFLYFLEYLLKEDLVEFYGAYDKKNNREVKWNGSTEELMGMLRDFIKNYPQKMLEENPVHFFDFKYCFLVWTIDWPEVQRRFNLKV